MKKLKTVLFLLLFCSGFHQASAQSCKASFSTNRPISVLDSQTIFSNTSSYDSTFNVHYLWTINNVPTSTSRNFSYTFPTIGFYQVRLLRIDSTNNCTDSFSKQIRVTYQVSCYTRLIVKDTIDSCHVVFIPRYEDKRPIDSINIDFNDGNDTTILLHQRVVHKYGKTYNYRPLLTSYAGAGNCRMLSQGYHRISGCNGKMLCDNKIEVKLRVDSATLADSINDPDVRYRRWNAIAYLIQKKQDTLNLVDSIYREADNRIKFEKVCAQSFYIKAALDSTDSFYHDFLPTYYGNVLRWDKVPAPIRFFGIDKSKTSYIDLIKGVNPGGPGFISGLVTQGANKKEGDPIGGIQIMAMNAKNEPVAYTYSRKDGRFIFENLPVGKFYVYAEIPGINILGNWITLTKDTVKVKDVKIEVTKDYASTSILYPEQALQNPINFYPNPTQNLLNISVGQSNGRIIVSDLSGRQFVQADIEHSLVLDLEALESGAYIISFISESGLAFRKTLIKE